MVWSALSTLQTVKLGWAVTSLEHVLQPAVLHIDGSGSSPDSSYPVRGMGMQRLLSSFPLPSVLGLALSSVVPPEGDVWARPMGFRPRGLAAVYAPCSRPSDCIFSGSFHGITMCLWSKQKAPASFGILEMDGVICPGQQGAGSPRWMQFFTAIAM